MISTVISKQPTTKTRQFNLIRADVLSMLILLVFGTNERCTFTDISAELI